VSLGGAGTLVAGFSAGGADGSRTQLLPIANTSKDKPRRRETIFFILKFSIEIELQKNVHTNYSMKN